MADYYLRSFLTIVRDF